MMPQSLLTLGTLLLIAVILMILYFLGQNKHIGRMYAVVFVLVGKVLLRIEQWLTPFDTAHRTNGSKYPGLRTIILTIALVLAVSAFTAEAFNTIQALSTLFPDANITMPVLPGFLNFSMGLLFLAIPALTGSIWLEGKKVLPEEAHIFAVQDEYKEKFEKFVVSAFVLSIISSVAFYALKAVYLASSDSNGTHLLQIIVFILLGISMPLVGAIILYVLAVGLHAVLGLLLSIAWFLAAIGTDICHFLALIFLNRDDKELLGVRVIQNGTAVVESEASTPAIAAPENEPVPALLYPAPFVGRKRDEFPIIDNGKPGFKERVNWALNVLAEKAPHRLQELVEYLPKIKYDSSLINGKSWKANSHGFFGYDLSDDEVALFVLAHETGHNVQIIQNNDSSEDAANHYAHEVMVELGRA
jgi:hypothetical protein